MVTESAMHSHALGETFVAIRPGTLQEVVFLPSALGSTASIKARGLADDDAAPVEISVAGEAMRPPSPVDLRAEIQTDGGLLFTWVRRSRLGWMWPANSEVPLGESSERYRIDLEGASGALTFHTSEPQITIPSDALAGRDGEVAVRVVQLGDFAESRPATATIVI